MKHRAQRRKKLSTWAGSPQLFDVFVMNFYSDFHGLRTMNLCDFREPGTLLLAPADLHFWVKWFNTELWILLWNLVTLAAFQCYEHIVWWVCLLTRRAVKEHSPLRPILCVTLLKKMIQISTKMYEWKKWILCLSIRHLFTTFHEI